MVITLKIERVSAFSRRAQEKVGTQGLRSYCAADTSHQSDWCGV